MVTYLLTDGACSIIAVHGLNGHRHSSWTAENKVFWLKDLLPFNAPQARVYTFGYDARTHSRDPISRDTFYGHAETLLHDLSLQRRWTEVCHVFKSNLNLVAERSCLPDGWATNHLHCAQPGWSSCEKGSGVYFGSRCLCAYKCY